jgi:glutamate racemase
MTNDLAREPDAPPHAPHEFLATGDPEPFRRLGRRFLGPEIGVVTALAGTPAVAGR